MSRSIVRSLTVALTLAALLCLAAPAAAAPASRPVSPAVLGPSLLDQFVAWLGGLWRGHEPQRQAPVKTTSPLGGSGSGVSNQMPQATCDAGGMTDPNG